jgi:hypothetical protein
MKNSTAIFADEQNPIRASTVISMLKCPFKVMALWDQYIYDSAGEAAQTGSLLHAGAEEFHRTGELVLALDRLKRDTSKFPLADYDRAKKMFDGYASDRRNALTRLSRDRLEVRFTEQIDPHPADKTRQPIFITGQLDQIRDDLLIYDIKSSTRPSGVVNTESCIQLWIYCWLAQKNGIDVSGYKLIMTNKYVLKQPKLDEVFVDGLPYDERRVGKILQDIRLYTMLIRNRESVPIGPGEHCSWCPMNSPHTCLGVRVDKDRL